MIKHNVTEEGFLFSPSRKFDAGEGKPATTTRAAANAGLVGLGGDGGGYSEAFPETRQSDTPAQNTYAHARSATNR